MSGTTFWMVKKYFTDFIFLNHIHHLQKRLTLHIIKYIKLFSFKPDSFRQFFVRVVAERTTRFHRLNNGISAVSIFSRS